MNESVSQGRRPRMRMLGKEEAVTHVTGSLAMSEGEDTTGEDVVLREGNAAARVAVMVSWAGPYFEEEERRTAPFGLKPGAAASTLTMSVAPRSIARMTGTRPYACNSVSRDVGAVVSVCHTLNKDSERDVTYAGNSVRLDSMRLSEHLDDIGEAAFDGDDDRQTALRRTQQRQRRQNTVPRGVPGTFCSDRIAAARQLTA